MNQDWLKPLFSTWITPVSKFNPKLLASCGVYHMMVSASYPRPGISCSPPTTENYKLEIVKADGLNPLLRLLQSPDRDSIYNAVSCVSNLALHPTSRSPIIEAGFLQPLVELLSFKDHENTQSRAARVLRNLAESPENRRDIFNAGAVQSIKKLVLQVPVRIQIQMICCIENLSLCGMDSPFHPFFDLIPPR